MERLAAHVISITTDSNQYQETNLETHDMALCLPSGSPGSNHFFRLILLCPDDMTRAETPRHIEQLHRLEGGKNAAIIFLVDEDVTKGATLAFTKLQMELVMPNHPGLHLHLLTAEMKSLLSNPVFTTSPIPLIPLPMVLALPETLQTFQASLTASQFNRHHLRPQDIALDLVPHCVVGRPLSNQTTGVLINSCHSIKDMVDALALEGSEASLASALGGDMVEAKRVISFWEYEFGLE